MQNNYEESLIKNYVHQNLQQEALEKLHSGYPVQYIIGNVDFMGNILKVNENVLIPRFETEYLVDETVKLLKKYNFQKPNVLDIGTGSGCIAICLKKMYDLNVTALDISEKALDVAKENAKQNKVDINFINGDINDYVFLEKYDVIISNPPYVPINSSVDPKIKYEPQNAIYAPEDGLYFYNIIFKRAKDVLNNKFIMAFEIGKDMGQILCDIAKEYFPNSNIYFKKDLNNIDRYLYIINE